MIEQLTGDNERLRSELSRVKRDFDQTSARLKEQEEILDQCQERIATLIVESDSTKTELEWKVEDLGRARVKLEEEMSALRKKVQSLQVELDNSEAVQRDFVKLSQSLQVRLLRRAASSRCRPRADSVGEDSSGGLRSPLAARG